MPAETVTTEIPDWALDDDEEPVECATDFDDCGLCDDGQCTMAGTEYCDFECQNRDSELFVGSKVWKKKHQR